MATCLDVSGATYPAGKTPPEGKSLVPAFAGKPLERDLLAWEHEGNRAIRVGKWKLVARHDAPWELYDIDADRAELHDLASANPERVKELAAKWDEWAKRTHVLPKPTPKKKKEPK
jgi:arylsulfatase